MRKNFILLILLVFTISFFCCEEDGTLVEVYLYPKALWGEWIRMDTGETWYFSSNYIKTEDNSYSSFKKYTFNKQSDNVIEVKSSEDDFVFYLYASRIPNSSFKAAILKGDGVSANISQARKGRAIAAPGGIAAKVPNVNNPKQSPEAVTDAEGILVVDGVIAGDTYDVIIDGDDVARITPNADGEEIGNIVLIPKGSLNFTTSIHPVEYDDGSKADMMGLYKGDEEWHIFEIRFTNTGTITSSLTSYTITPPDGLIVMNTLPDGSSVEGPLTGMLGTIKPGDSDYIWITAYCPSITEEYEFKKISINLKDNSGSNLEWNDTVSLKYNKNYIDFNVKAMGRKGGEGSVNAIVIVPGGKAYHKKFTGPISPKEEETEEEKEKKRIRVPKYLDKDYLIVFSGATQTDESSFSFIIDFDPVTIPVNFVPGQDPNYGGAFYTNNNREDLAQQIDSNENILSFLGLNDIIYFKVRFQD